MQDLDAELDESGWKQASRHLHKHVDRDSVHTSADTSAHTSVHTSADTSVHTVLVRVEAQSKEPHSEAPQPARAARVGGERARGAGEGSGCVSS